MTVRPLIKPGMWIDVENVECVVANVRESGHAFGDCEVVCCARKPANREVRWNGEAWNFVESNDFGGYAASCSRLNTYVAILKRGRFAI